MFAKTRRRQAGCIDAAADAASYRKSRCFLGAPTLDLDAFQNKDFHSKIDQHTIRKYNKHDGTGCSNSLLHEIEKARRSKYFNEKTLFLPTCLMSRKPASDVYKMKSAQNVQSPINSLSEAKSLEVVCFVTFLQQPVKYVTHVALFYSLFIF